MPRIQRITLSSALLFLASCGTNPTPTPTPVPEVSACPVQEKGTNADGAPVYRCTKLFDTPPLVRPPADVVPAGDGAVTIYGTISGSAESPANLHLTDRAGTSYEVLDDAGAAAGGSTPFVAQNKLQTNRVNVTVYEVKGTRRGTQILVESVRPAILVDGHAVDERLLGTWEGTLSRRNPDGTWAWDDDAHAVPFRFVIDRLEPMAALPADSSGAPLADAPRSRAVGHVENMETAVTLADASCAPALASYGDENPLKGATSGEFGLWRETMMHSPDLGEFNLVNDYPKGVGLDGASGMTLGDRYALPSLLRADREEAPMIFRIHGTPMGKPVIKLARVSGGGGACTK